jgi:hypothetical protein
MSICAPHEPAEWRLASLRVGTWSSEQTTLFIRRGKTSVEPDAISDPSAAASTIETRKSANEIPYRCFPISRLRQGIVQRISGRM